MRKILLVLSILVATAAPTVAQGFPWDIFKPRTLKEVTATTSKAVRPDDTSFFATTLLESKMQVTFTGESRPMLPARKQFVSNWACLANQKTMLTVTKPSTSTKKATMNIG
jgi:hypothetical protein